jgi:hypothetical protein
MLILTSATTVVTISSLTLNVVQGFLALVFFDPGHPFPSAPRTLFHYNLYLVAIADIPIAATVFLCKRFPVWTTWVWLAIAACSLLGLKFPSSRAFEVMVDLEGIAGASLGRARRPGSRNSAGTTASGQRRL